MELTTPPPPGAAEPILNLVAVALPDQRVEADLADGWIRFTASVDLGAAREWILAGGGTIDARAAAGIAALTDVKLTVTLNDVGNIVTVIASGTALGSTQTLELRDVGVTFEVTPPDVALVDPGVPVDPIATPSAAAPAQSDTADVPPGG